MKKWFATLLVGLLALCWCGSALADELPETDEITAYVPASICWGEDLTVSAVLPTDSGHLRVAVNTPYTVARDNWISDRSVEYTFEANEMIEQGLKPGNYFVTFNCQNDAREQTVCLPLEVTGEEKAPPTISSDKLYAMAGETVVFSGEAGAASKIHLDIYWQEYDTISDLHVDVNAEADGTWSYEAVMPANACMYSVQCEGYTADGLATGRLERISVGVYDADIPAPALQLITENPVANSTIRISMETAGVSTESWIVKLVDEATGEIRSPWYSNWEPYTCEVLTDYGGEYTLYASYCANGKLSVPAELHITSDGSAHPSNGKIPINVTAPAAILAGQDAVFAIDYADDSQTVNYVFGQMDESGEFRMDYYSRTVSAGKPFTIPGYLLYNGAFCRLVVRSEAEDWYSNSEDYSFTVSSNPDQSQAPVLSLAEEQSVYYGIPVRLSAGEGWDRVAIRYTENGDSSNWELYNPSKIYFTCFSAGNVKIIARGLKNGVWSEVSQPLALTVEEVPQVDEITPLTPSSIVFGEDLPVAVLLPEGEGEILISLDLPNEYSESLWTNTRYCSNIINASTLFSWRMMPGRYTVTYTWNHDGQTETVTRPLEVTGEAKTPITVSADHTSATAGDTVVFSGETGDASRIEGYIAWSNNNTATNENISLNVTPRDSWNYSVTVPDGYTSVNVSFAGYTSDGLFTGQTDGNVNIVIYDASLAAPEIQLLTENPESGNCVSLAAETTAENVERMEMRWIDDTTGDVDSGWNYNDQRIEYSFYPSYAGDYTVQVYYCVDGRHSTPAELHLTVTGTPHPSHGKVPITFTAPEAIPAGLDAVFALDYAAEGQSFNWNLDKWNEDGGFDTVYWGGTLRNGEALTVPGYLLEANAAYRLSINSEAEDWYSNYRDYQFTVSANPDQPQAPVLALAEGETAYTRIPVRFTADEGWEKISLRYVGDDSSSEWNEYNPSNLSLRFDVAETVQVYAHGLKNGVWSEVSQPLTLTVEELPQVTEITPLTPSSVRWGEDLLVSALFPYDYGTVSVTINTPDPYSDNSYLNSHVYSQRFYASGMIHYGLMPGSYTITYTWEDGDQTETISRPLEVTGDAKEPSTISVDRNYAVEGDQIVYSGETGDAVRIQLQIRRYIDQQELIDYVWLNVTPNSTWSYTVTAQENVSEYATYCEGYTSDNLCTGYNYAGSVEICDASLAAPAIQLLTENPLTGQENRLSVEAPTEIEYWDIYWVDETTGERNGPWLENTRHSEFSFYPGYAGEYTVYAFYFANGGKRSAPAELHITAGGTPHPSHGKVPIEFTAPEAIPAGLDAVFALDYAVEGQSFNWNLDKWNEYNSYSTVYWGNTLRNGEALTVPGYLLEANAAYRLSINSEAEDWYSNYRDYEFTVSANPDQPQAPVLALAEGETVHTRIPVRFTVDEGWERISLRYVVDDSSSEWNEYNPSNLSLCFDVAETVDVYARGLKNGVWSEVSQPLTLTVEELTQVTEIIPLTPSSMRWGEDLFISVLFPCDHGTLTVTINTPDVIIYSCSIGDTDEYSVCLVASGLINNGLVPGAYTVTYTWIHSGITETVSRPLEVTGEVKTPITVSTDHTSATVGDTIVFSGETGDASRIDGYIQWSNNEDWTSDNFTLNVTPGGSWSYSVTVPEGWTSLYASFAGYTSDRLYTREINGEQRIVIYDASLAAPAIQLLTENPMTGQQNYVSLEAPTEIEQWDVEYIDETTGVRSRPWVENTQQSEFSFYPNYAGEYTVYASYIANGGKRSVPAELQITVTGTPHPSHGKVPIEFTAPEAILAGQDAVFALDYAAEGQSFNWNLDKWNEYNSYSTVYWGNTLRNGEALTVPGYLLEADAVYRLRISSEAEDWYSNYRDYEFMVSANPDQPQAPVLALAEGETVYTRIPVRFAVNEGWERISLRYVGDNSSSEWNEYNPSKLSLRFNTTETVRVYARGLKNGVWSEVSEPLTITVEELPPVTEIIPLTSSSMRWGEDLFISVLFPCDHGTFRVTINTPDVSNYSWGISDTDEYSVCLVASGLINNGLVPGAYTVTYTWIHSGITETVSRPLEVTGEVKTPITVSADHTSATAGDTIVFSGETGDASKIEGHIEWSNNEDWTSDNFTLNVTPNGSWSYSVTVPEGWTSLSASFAGYTSAGLYTGTINGSHDIRIYDTSLAAPTVQLLTENPVSGRIFSVSVEAPTEIEYWDIYWVDETTGDIHWLWIGDTRCSEFYPNMSYAGEYTVYASYFANGGKRSVPAVLHLTVTGTPHPSHGKVPIEFTAPEAILAGQDAVFALDYAAEGQSFNWNLDKWNEYNSYSTVYWGNTLRNGEALTVPGYLLEADAVYRLRISSEAEDWYSNYRDYEFMVSANPDQPQPPVLTMEDEEAFIGAPVRFSVDDGWETIAVKNKITKDGSTSNDNWYRFSSSTKEWLWTYREGTTHVTVYVKGLKNGVWSAASQPVDFDVIDGPKLGQVQVASAPKQLTVGQPFTVVLEPLENAERYKLSLLYYNNDNGQLVDVGCGLSYNQPVLTFPSWNWDDFDGEGNFQIVLSAEADGYNGLTSEYRISLTGAKPSPVEERVYTLPSALTEIEEEAFAESNATVIVVPSGCQSIGKKAFADCASLTRIVIPATVTAIADDAFDGCGTLTIVTSQGSAAYDLALDKGYTLDLSN